MIEPPVAAAVGLAVVQFIAWFFLFFYSSSPLPPDELTQDSSSSSSFKLKIVNKIDTLE